MTRDQQDYEMEDDEMEDDEIVFDHPKEALLEIAHDMANPDEFETMPIFLKTLKNASEILTDIANGVVWTEEEIDEVNGVTPEAAVTAGLPLHWLS